MCMDYMRWLKRSIHWLGDMCLHRRSDFRFGSRPWNKLCACARCEFCLLNIWGTERVHRGTRRLNKFSNKPPVTSAAAHNNVSPSVSIVNCCETSLAEQRFYPPYGAYVARSGCVLQ